VVHAWDNLPAAHTVLEGGIHGVMGPIPLGHLHGAGGGGALGAGHEGGGALGAVQEVVGVDRQWVLARAL